MANGGAGSVSAYAISASGALTIISGSPYVAGNSPSSVAVDTLGIYVEEGDKQGSTTHSQSSVSKTV